MIFIPPFGKEAAMTEDEVVRQIGALTRRYYADDQFSCAEALVRAFAEVFASHRFDPVAVTRLATPFNGGFSELKRTCGVLTGGLLAIGMVAGRDQPADEDAKQEAYTLAQIFHRRFMDQVQTESCAELLTQWKDQGVNKAHCKRHTAEMAEMLARTILQVGFHELELDDADEDEDKDEDNADDADDAKEKDAAEA
ncbi:MAG: C_GCAxxG_C_C family protein [Magnetococcales bacterium]|nr:C_GCAxxG_C_C family protein [Magnetococcales bacterium]